MASTFDYYSRLKKVLYCAHLIIAELMYLIFMIWIIFLDMKKKQLQEDMLDNSTLEQIANKVDEKIENIRYQYVNDDFWRSSTRQRQELRI